MKTKLLFIWAALGLLFAACEEEETSKTTVIYRDDPYTVNIYAGLPGVYGYMDGPRNEIPHPVSDVTIAVYRSKEDYVSDRNRLIQGPTNEEGRFTFEYDSIGSLWFSAHKDTLSNLRGVSKYGQSPEHNEIVIAGWKSNGFQNYHRIYATLTNSPTRLQLSVSHQGQPVEGATVQLYFTEQTYQDSLAAQEDFEHLRPTYGHQSDDPDLPDPIGSFIYRVEDNFLQTTNEAGEVFFDNLEPRNYWFRITKDTLSNEGTVVRTREALPRDADISNIMTVGIE
jgi:hypothetical protein